MTGAIRVPPDPDGIPETMRERPVWVCWRVESRDGDPTKVPVNPTSGEFASSTDPATWSDFATAVEYHDREATDTAGIGYMFTSGGPYAGVDLDDCRDPDSGDLDGWARTIVDCLASYTQVSSSGTGLHVIVEGEVPDGGNRSDVHGGDGEVEMYDEGRYFAMTGQALDADSVDTQATPQPRQDALNEVHAEFVADDDGSTSETATGTSESPSLDLNDEDLIERAKDAENGENFRRLWNGDTSGYKSHSEARMALANHLAFWTGGDERQMLRLFKASNLYRGDDDIRTFEDYEIPKALKDRTEFYDPDEATGGDGSEPTVEPQDDTDPDPERVDSPLVDAILNAPERWIDKDSRTWRVRDTDDRDAEEIADALRDGELPGDAWAALADVILSGDAPEELEEALQEWNSDPDKWDVEVARTFSETELSPNAIAAAADVAPSDLGSLKSNELAELVWRRLRKHKAHHFLTRHPDETLLAYDHASGTWNDTGEASAKALAYDALDTAYSERIGRELVDRIQATRETWVDAREMGPPADTVPVTNGLLDLEDREIRPLEPDDHVLARLPVEFDPDADAPQFKAYLKDVVPNAADRHLLQEYVGYTLMHWGVPFHKALFLVGPQSSGKSTFLDVVRALLGDDATCSLAPQEFTEERFAGYDLVGAWANIRSDIPSDLIQNTGKFKEIVAGDPVKVERKYKDPITVEPTAKHFFAANTLPSAEIEDDAFFRRILLVSFPDTIPRDERDPHLAEKLKAELPGILNWALDGLDRLRDEGRFTGWYGPEEIRDTWEMWGESVKRFKSRCLDTSDSGARAAKATVYDAYTRFCKAEGIPAESRRKFTRELKRDGAITDGARVTVDGERKRAFSGIEINDERVPDPATTTDESTRDGRLGSYGGS